MPKAKVVYISEEAHQRLRILAARKNRPMGEVVEDLIDQELTDITNPWISAEGLRLQERALAYVWDDPALDIYNDD
ncbi:MAG: hypothetical protein HY660_04695 [Armatimonadetes bacterium]|nr:hypothetical protein [Armatimonadota bacterium]